MCVFVSAAIGSVSGGAINPAVAIGAGILVFYLGQKGRTVVNRLRAIICSKGGTGYRMRYCK